MTESASGEDRVPSRPEGTRLYAEESTRDQPAVDDPAVADPAYADQGYTDQGYTDQGYADQGNTDQGFTDQGNTDQGYGDEGYGDDSFYPGGEGDPPGGGGWSGGGGFGGGRRRRRLVAHPVIAGLVIALVTILIAGALTFVWAAHRINPPGKPGAATTVVVPIGASTSKIGSILSHAGVIRGAGLLWEIYVKVQGGGSLKPGTYHLKKNSSYGTVVSALQAGPPEVDLKLTIPEGYTLAQIAAKVGALPGANLSAAKFLAAANNGEVRSPYEPAGTNDLEGLLFPATYQVRVGETEDDVLEQLVGAFDNEAQTLGLTTAATARHMTPYQLVTVASIVEREAKLAGDRGGVASVLYNRLARNMPLGADSTLIYALRMTDPTLDPATVNFDQPNPYNTRLNIGLPPTPIANPGIPSLQAAVSPPTTTYLYFVETDPSGKLSFASTSQGFAQLQVECRAAKLC